MARTAGAMITYNDARLMVSSEGYTQKKTIPVSDQCMSKAKIEEYLYASVGGAYASNQLVPYNKVSKVISLKPFQINQTERTSGTIACDAAVTSWVTMYHDSISTYPSVGALIYTDEFGTTLFTSTGSFWYKMNNGRSAHIDKFGEVKTILTCSTGEAVQPISMSELGANSVSGACALSINYLRYHNGLGLIPIIGDKFFTSLSGTTVFMGANLNYKLLSNITVVIDNTGTVKGVDESCTPQ